MIYFDKAEYTMFYLWRENKFGRMISWGLDTYSELDRVSLTCLFLTPESPVSLSFGLLVDVELPLLLEEEDP